MPAQSLHLYVSRCIVDVVTLIAVVVLVWQRSRIATRDQCKPNKPKVFDRSVDDRFQGSFASHPGRRTTEKAGTGGWKIVHVLR